MRLYGLNVMLACSLIASASPADAQPIVLDDYASDANFLAGSYQFIDVNAGYHPPGEDGNPQSQLGQPHINIIDERLNIASRWTAAHMWLGGERLSNIGDRVSMDILVANPSPHAAGMFFDADLTNAYQGAEIRYQNGYLKNTFLNNGVRQDDWVPIVTQDREAGYGEYFGETTRYEAMVVGKDAAGVTIRVGLTSGVFEPAYVWETVPGEALYFGPAAWFGGFPSTDTRPGSGNIFHDNLTFTPAPTDTVPGDLNGDGAMTDADISAFVLALTDPPGYANAHPTLAAANYGDFNSDGQLSNGDIQGFLDALASNGANANALPEPASIMLLGLSGWALLRRRRACGGGWQWSGVACPRNESFVAEPR